MDGKRQACNGAPWALGALLLIQACGSEALSTAAPNRQDASATGLDAGQVDGSGEAGPPDGGPMETADGGLLDASIGDQGDGPSDGSEPPSEVTIGGDRPAVLLVPRSYDGAPMPMVLSLHGYGGNGIIHDAYFGLSARVDQRGFFLVSPDGTREGILARNRFWNATDACCNFAGSSVDDVAYLVGLVDEASSLFEIDPNRIYVVGHSNGGFMAYRLACDAADRIAAVVSLAGATYVDDADCAASQSVSVLQIHGSNDRVIRYEGGVIGPNAYPGAEETVARWAARAGCASSTPDQEDMVDLDVGIPGAESDVFTYGAGCENGIDVSLWRINSGGHVPALVVDYADRILDFLFAHPKP
ncbi:MAG: alpha/beta hydrolase family esterase [Myxococcota bacterium]